MSFTPLQRVALSQAEAIADSLEKTILKLAQKHEFVSELCTFDTLENDWSKSVRTLCEILNALRTEH